MASPEAASKTEPISERAVSGAKTMGTRCVATRRAPSLRSARLLRLSANSFRGFEVREAPRARPPAVPLHLAVCIYGQRRRGHSRVAGAIAAHKAARIGQRLSARGSIKAAAVGVGNARVGGQRRGLGPPRPLDALRPCQRVDILVVEVLILGNRAELARLRQPGKPVLFGHARQRQRALHKLANSLRSQIAC